MTIIPRAFPSSYNFGADDRDVHLGMDLRDYFAAKAMQSITSTLHQGIRPVDIASMCKDAYVIADAMLREREK